MLFDAHLHLSEENSNLDLINIDKIINNAKNQNIKYFINNSVDLATINNTILIASKYNNIFMGLGIFPTEFKNSEDLKKIDILRDKIKELKEKKEENRIIIGEIGLDFKFEYNKELQEKAFIEQLKIAKENDFYVEIHSRFAVKQTLEILNNFNYNKVIMHWFLDSKKYVEKAVEKGYFITIGPKYLYDENVKEIIKNVPKEQILFETDYPATVSNILQEPSQIKKIFDKYCEDFSINKEEMIKILGNNLKKIFSNFDFK